MTNQLGSVKNIYKNSRVVFKDKIAGDFLCVQENWTIQIIVIIGQGSSFPRFSGTGMVAVALAKQQMAS